MGTSACKNIDTTDQSQIKTYDCRNVVGLKQQELIVQPHNQQRVNQLNNDINPIQLSQYDSNPSPRNHRNSKEDNLSPKCQQIMSKNTANDNDNSILKSESRTQCVMVSRLRNNKIQIVGDDNYQPIPVAFNVVLLTIPKQIKQQLLLKESNFVENHSNPNCHTFRGWRLRKQGFYVNICTQDQRIFLVSQDQIYWGRVKLKTLIPDKKGLLITKDGAYDGQFQNGKANGKGIYSWRNNRVKQFEGLWSEGIPLSGTITGVNFMYKGDLKKGTPHGDGVLYLKSVKGQIKYQGKFNMGRYEDKDAQYSTTAYIYKGGFKNGAKHGFGQYTQKKKSRIQGGRTSLQRLQGQWQNDNFIGII